MGYIRHNAILVTTSYADIAAARAKAEEFGNTCTPITDSPVNGYRTFVVVPDGSKEYWDASDAGDVARASFLTWLHQQDYEDGSNPFAWVEVVFGDEDGPARIGCAPTCDDGRRARVAPTGEAQR